MGFSLPRPRVPRTFRSLKVNEDSVDSRWANPDILPVPYEDQKYNWKAYIGYWMTTSFTTAVWTASSANIANGLDAGAAIAGIFVGSFITGFIAFFCGEPGIRYHMNFPMMSRACFGMYGSYFVVVIKCFVNFIFFGIQAYWGGLAMNIVLSAIFPSFANMANTIPVESAITTKQLVGFIIYIVLFTGLMFVHPTKLQPILYVSQFAVWINILGIFIWAMSTAKGARFLPPAKTIDSQERSFRILQAMSSIAGTWTSGAIRQSDWTRFARSRHSTMWHQIFTGPICLTICATMGVATTSAIAEMYGTPIWNPITLLEFLQGKDYSATTRAGTFFAGLGFFISQIAINLTQNSVSAGMDLSSLWPKYVDVTRGALFMCIVGYLIQPWRFVNQPGIFLSVLNGFGMCVSPLAGINCVDFWILRRFNWKVPDLYRGDKSSIYWYTAGLNWRAFLAFILVIWPSFPGFIASFAGQGSLNLAWIRIYQVTWLVGFFGGSTVYFLITYFFPNPGKPYVTEYLEGYEPGARSTDISSGGEDDLKNTATENVKDLEKH